MLVLHAPDKPGEIAHKAGQFAHVVNFNLLAAQSATIPTAKRLEALERVFTAWPALCRCMAELEEVAPKCAEAGFDNAAMLREIAERAQDTTGVR